MSRRVGRRAADQPSALDGNARVIATATCALERFYAGPFALIG
ncbi:hypothetical protein OHA25_44360 [Nonomuraea sp. NBC_00507]